MRLAALSVRAALMSSFVGTLAASPAGAWSNSSNINTPVIVDVPQQIIHNTVSDGAGGMFVGWTTFSGVDYHVYLQHLDPTGAKLWSPSGVLVAATGGSQVGSQMVSDDAGGMIVCWIDNRNGNFDIFAQRFNATGAPQWVANGVPVVVAAGTQNVSDMIPDGAGGLIVSWDDGRGGNNDPYIQRLNASGTALWTPNGVALSTDPALQYFPEIVSDGAGNTFVTWADERSGVPDVYAQKINAAGAPQWGANGLGVCTEPFEQSGPIAVTDGSTGVYITWKDYRGGGNPHVYGQHLMASGASAWLPGGIPLTSLLAEDQPFPLADGLGNLIVSWADYRGPDAPDLYIQKFNGAGNPQWQSNGVPLTVAPGTQSGTWWMSDDQGGAIVVWQDTYLQGNTDIYAQRVANNGSLLWSGFNGIPVSTGPGNQTTGRATSDGAHGMLLAFLDDRNQAGSGDVYGERVEQFGQLGNPEADITNVRDVANDQGGQVRVSWLASYLDVGFYSLVNEYRLWRRVPIRLALQRIAQGASLKTTGSDATASFWEYVATQPANGFPSYSMVAATEGDSLAGSNPRTSFLVEARYSYGGQHWDSQPDSGYSVDNLGPPTPAPFTGNYSNGTSYLTWGNNPAPDLSNYRLYRGSSSTFVPNAGNRIATPTQNSYADPVGGLFVYKLSAVDVHGNESGYATLLPSAPVDVPDPSLPVSLRISPPAPNPARNGTAFRIAMPAAARVKAEILDQQGRVVRSLADQTMGAGERELSWDGRTEAGSAVPSGLYFYCIVVGDRTMKGRVAIVR